MYIVARFNDASYLYFAAWMVKLIDRCVKEIKRVGKDFYSRTHRIVKFIKNPLLNMDWLSKH